MGQRLKDIAAAKKAEIPGPDIYTLRGSISNAQAKTFGSRLDQASKVAPGPGEYSPEKKKLSDVAFT
jgi:hypothetical protein